MRGCKHVWSRCFALRALITQLKTRQIYFIYPFLRRMKLGNLYEHAVPILFRLGWHFKRENPFFGKHLSTAKQELIARTLNFVYKTSRLVRISLLISNLNKEFFFFLGKVILRELTPRRLLTFHQKCGVYLSAVLNTIVIPLSTRILINSPLKCGAYLRVTLIPVWLL